MIPDFSIIYTVRKINGRDELEIPVKAKFDGEYVEKISFIQDVKIILLTVVKIFKREKIVEGKKEEENKEEGKKEE